LKVLRFVAIPAMVVGMLSLVTATAYANHAQISATLNCTSATNVCFNLTVSTTDFPTGGRDITVTLLGHQTGDSNASHFTQIGTPQTVHLAKGLDNATVPVCFADVSAAGFDMFKIKIQAVGSQFDVNGSTYTTLGPFNNTCSTQTPTPTPTPTATPTPTPTATSGATPTPTATATAETTVALAQTGGFDFRFPLIGLILLVAGGALYVVSASRGRSASSK
jgi:hypothetical protein